MGGKQLNNPLNKTTVRLKTQVYFIPGMFANSKIFERIRLPKNQFETHFLGWQMPLHKRESLASYVSRLSQEIKHQHPVFIGVSFGGIIAQELVKIFPKAKVIIISSIKHQNEFKASFKFYKTTQLYRLFPITFFNFTEPIIHQLGSKKTKKKLEVYRNYLSVRNRIYTHWAIHHFLHWQQTQKLQILHLHGTKDTILPIQHITNKVEVKRGNHAMILAKASIIKQHILAYIS